MIFDYGNIQINKEDQKLTFVNELALIYNIILYLLELNTDNNNKMFMNLVYTMNMIYNYTQELPSSQKSICTNTANYNLINSNNY